MIRPPESHPNEPNLPFDPITVALSVITRWRWAVLVCLGAGVAGVVLGLGAGTRVYTAESVLLHRPRPSVWIGPRERGVDSLSLRTKLNLVKVRSNMEEVRERLGLASTLAQLGSAIAVTDQRDTDLLIIRAQWSDPAVAQGLTTTMSEVFLKSQLLIRYREERSVVEQLRREAVDEAARIQAQLDDFGRITSDLQRRIALERADSPEDEGLGQLSLRMSQIRDAIQDDQSQRANTALRQQAELHFSRVESLHSRGAATDQELERARAELARLEALTVDTEQVASWRAELERLQSVVLPSGDEVTASGPLLQAVMFRALEAEFDLASARERVAQFEAVRAALDEQILALDRYRGAGSGDPEPSGLAESDFQIVTPARLPVRPSSSNRRMVAAAAFIMLASFGLIVLVGIELVTTRVRSGRELALRGEVPVLGVIPVEGSSISDRIGGEARDRILAQSLLNELPSAGSLLLVASAEPGEGRSTTTLRFARAVSELGERVLIVDGGVAGGGLSLPAALGVETGVHEAPVPTGTCLPLVDYLAPVRPEQGSGGAAAVVRAIADAGPGTFERYRLVLIDGPAVLPDADAQRLVEVTDGVLMVTCAHRTRGRSVRTALERLKAGKRRLVVGVLNATREPFLHLT